MTIQATDEGVQGSRRTKATVTEVPQVAVVVPCYNEAATIEKVVVDFLRELPSARIYVFDNNSTDGSGELAQQAGAHVIQSHDQGKGNVVRHMAEVVDADVYVLVDGDDTYPASAAPEMIDRFQRDGLDMLVGIRLDGPAQGAFRSFHWLGNRLISGLVSVLFRTRVRDVLSGYRVLSRRFVNIVRVRTHGFEVEMEMTLQALSKLLSVAEMPISYGARPEGSTSKLSTWGDGILIVRCILLLFMDYKPLIFFSTMALLLAIASLLSGSAPIWDFIESGYVFHVPRAILAVGLGVLSLICLTVGVILDTVSRLHKETVEFWKMQLHDRSRNRT